MSTSRHALVIGANRGIGLELARLFAARGHRVTATCRADRGALQGLDGVEVIDGIDLEHPDSLSRLAEGASIDDLIVNAGIYPHDGDGKIALDALMRGFAVNAAGPLLAVQALDKRLGQGSRVLLITSRMGSIGDNDSGHSYAYRMSKAALNMAGKTLSIDLKSRGISVGIIHPGFVKTDMTKGQGLIDTRESATGILARLDQLDPSTTGTFWHQNGSVLPW